MLGLLGVAVFVYNFGAGIYYAYDIEPSPSLEFLYSSAFLCGVIWWLRTDEIRSAVNPVYCPGMLVGAGWFLIIPYHLLKTRGRKGVISLLLLIGSFFAAHILALIVSAILFSRSP